jgi:hypothetical protein
MSRSLLFAVLIGGILAVVILVIFVLLLTNTKSKRGRENGLKSLKGKGKSAKGKDSKGKGKDSKGKGKDSKGKDSKGGK